MNVLIDTNLIIDVFLQREPYFENSQLVLLVCEQKYVNGFVSASAITDIFYIVNKTLKNKTAVYELLKKHFIGAINIAAVDGDTIIEALNAEWDDFEDCVQYIAGESIFADYIVTRNPKDFVNANIEAVTPEEFLNILMPE